MPVAVLVYEIAELFLAVAGQRVGSDPGPGTTALRAQPGAPDHIRLHIREDPDFSELADGGVLDTSCEVPPAGFEPAHTAPEGA